MKRGILSAFVSGALALLVVGCQCTPAGTGAAPTPAPAPAQTYVAGSSTSTAIYPYNCGACGVLRVEKSVPAEVQLGEAFDYQIKVTNLTNGPVQNVVVSDAMPAGFKVLSSTPKATSTAGGVSKWALGAMNGGESKYIRVSGSATQTGSLEYCGDATFEIPNCVTTKVVEPALKVTVSAPESVLICDPIPIKYTVTNSGSGVAKDAKVTSALPKGVVASDGKTNLVFPVGNLMPGQTQELSATAKATKTGKFAIPVKGDAAGGLTADAAPATVTVKEPKLTITKQAPKRLYLGRQMTYEITVKNVGDAPADNTVVTDTLPAGVNFISASDGGVHSVGTVKWALGALYPNKSKALTVTVSASGVGDLRNVAKAEAVCTKAVSATASTNVKGIPAILLEVIDVSDPIPVGSNEEYIITATNQGSAVDTNIQIVCTLEANETYVSSSGATIGKAAGNVITFAPLPSLAAKAKAEWRVVVKAAKAGDVRFKVKMDTDQLTRPVEETEATHLYQ
ncbi:MAG: DUF11 domain-containing protein [Lentisphaerae bacterium]|nr:DUF11 domain-containing protein [Lentisphaerota bacterium]MBT4819106.1 DUF11 domain-containing protein [Lentisphaerota bacterium]MBT5609189.1 DUF11 domain-containing protein [Lentisphaerota bacterium]MBT7055200.1 DUF11 domain-containing protein [Lentisphaerota bacterium]MBT7847165.1 DUF11 domain-containing protein [Lentisphaerota bacterium]